jgi:hypothetical protein
VPRLGFWANGNEARVPYDVPDLLAAFAPQRPVLVVSPQLDREARLADVHWAVEATRTAWPANTPSGLEQLSPEDYNRFGPEMQTLVVSWLKKQAPPFITAAAAPR